MTRNIIAATVDTTRDAFEVPGWCITSVDWTMPAEIDAERFIRAATKGLADSLRRNIREHYVTSE